MPFTTDLVADSDARICYKIYSASDSYFDEINRRLARVKDTQMSLTFALVITYYNVRAYSTSSRMTFQVVLFSDGLITSFFFNYAANNQEWQLNQRVQIGFAYGSLLDPAIQYAKVTSFDSNSNITQPGMQPGYAGA